MDMNEILILVHILCMAGVFGGLLASLAAGAGASGDAAATGRAAMRPLNILLLVGFLAGMGLYVQRSSGGEAIASLHAVVGIKMLILVAVGALMGISGAAFKKENVPRGRLLQVVAAALCVVAAALGVSI
jgi:hypothetical protein